jgi:CPA1 family monovalent cation:H+ antiporter
VGTAIYFLAQLVSIPFEWIDCLIFGSIISPTDPIAVLGLLKELKAPEELTTIIAGESLFNDGVGIVVFNSLCAIKLGLSSPTFLSISTSFLTMGAGGIGLGLVCYWLLKKIFQNPLTFTQKIMLMIAFTTCGYELAEVLHISGALFVVTLGITTNHLVKNSTDKLIIFSFWEVIDEFLNLVLFLMMGMITIQISNQIELHEIYFALASIPLIILSRYICVKFALQSASIIKKQPKNLDIVISWAGLRGALAIALALSTPNLDNSIYHTLLVITYINVLFSVIIQGLSSKPLLKWYLNG